MAKVLPNFLTILESKEQFVDQLKGILSRYKKEFSLIVQSHLKGSQIKPVKKVQNNFTRSDFHYHDQSGELLHIYKLQFSSFISFILASLHDVFFQNRQIMNACIKDSEQIVSAALKETENLISGIFEEETCAAFLSTPWFDAKILQDSIIKQFFFEENSIAEIKNLIKPADENKPVKKKRDRRKIKSEVIAIDCSIFDMEIEEFRTRLELENFKENRERPNVTLDWIASIKKKIKKH